MGEEWKGGNVQLSTGGGQKINTLVRELEKYKADEHKIILFTDSYDVILLEAPEKVLEKFQATDARIVFGAETFCWPDPTLAVTNFFFSIQYLINQFLTQFYLLG
jgi:procollagen-lysine,2-oxoglutarate 5-dioxygenase